MKIRFKAIRRAIIKSLFLIANEIPPQLTFRTQLRTTGWTPKDKNDLTRDIDLDALKIFQTILTTELSGTEALICSEENPSGVRIADSGQLPRLIFIIDPIDNTDGGIHGSPAYSAVSLYDREDDTVVAAGFCDLYRREIFYADDEQESAIVHQKGSDFAFQKLTLGRRTSLEGSYITIYSLKPQRMMALASHKLLLDAIGNNGRIDNIGGSAGLARVAAGYIDAAVEFHKGFQAYDLFPGAYILKRAGGFCITPEGNEISFSLNIQYREDIPQAVKSRQKFIAAPTHALAFQILPKIVIGGDR